MRSTRKRGEIQRDSARSAWVVICLALWLTGCTRTSVEAVSNQYVTEYGLGPDKWATAWLLTRRADPAATLVVTKPGAPVVDGVYFDLPTSPLRRTGHQAAFEVAKAQFNISDPVIDSLAAIVHEMEINFWAASGPPETMMVEDAFRGLQHTYGRDAVTPECYVAFFDRVYHVLGEASTRGIPVTAERLHLSCDELMVTTDRNPLVKEIPLVDVVSSMAAGHKVIFVDVREPDEFAEGHIPGALNIPIREVGPHLRPRLSGADYVVSYCVKDFRGFEMAKALAEAGVENSVIMRPYGIKGWIARGLPVAGAKGSTESQADEALAKCVASVDECLAPKGGSI